MIEAFANYIPSTWFDQDGLRKSGRGSAVPGMVKRPAERWIGSAREVSLSIAMSAIVLTSIPFAQTAAASNEANIPVPRKFGRVAPPPSVGASLGDINESFASLFAAFRSGTKLITNDRTREVAKIAAARRYDRPEGWAHKLASDVGGADD